MSKGGLSASTLTLTNTNTYTGATSITAGTLALTSAASVNNSSGITINGGNAKLLQTSSAAITPAVTLTNGTLTGSGTVNTVNVGDATGGIVSNNDGVAGAALTIGALTFNGAATVNTFGNASPAIAATTLATNSAGLVTINPTAATWTTGVTYDLISYGGGIIGGGDFAQFTLGTITGKSARQTGSLVNTGAAVAVLIGGTTDFPYWVGDTDSQWDTTTINNWKLFTAGTYTNFIPTDDVLFNDNASGVGTITVNIDAADVATTTTTFDNSTKDYELNSSGGLFGVSAGTLTKNGIGNATFGTANATTGTTTINNGTMTQSGGTAISGTTAINNGTLSQTGGTATVGTLQIGGNSAAPGTTASLSLTGGTFSATTFDVLSSRDGMTSNLTIGGTAAVTLPTFPTNTKGTGATASITFDSTTGFLSPLAASTTYLPTGTFNNAYLTANGAKFNIPTGKNITIGQALENAVSPAAVGTLTKDGIGTLTLSSANTYTGTTTIIAGTLSLDNASALAGTSGITLGGASAATLSSTLSGITLAAPITTADTGVNSTIALGRNTNNTGSFTLNGAIGGAGNVVFTNPSGAESNNNLQTINLGAASNYAGTTVINPIDTGNTMTVRNSSGAANALPTTTVLIFGTRAGAGSSRASTYDLVGQNQTLAGLSSASPLPGLRNQRVTNTSVTPATLTINNTTDFTFGGSTLFSSVVTRAQISGAIALTKSGAGTFTLGGTLTGGATAGGNTYTGATTILGGILTLGETNSIQNSALDTAGSIAGDATNGLQTTVTALTIGGLTGNKNLADVFTTTAGGYGALTALTLNPGTGASHSYSGGIADGAAGMTLTKNGAGTQTLSGTNTYTGATTVSAGTLALVGGSQSSPITVNNLASLGFTLESGTTSTSTVTFDTGSSVTITGTPAPATSYTLMTTTATISGPLALNPLIPGFELQIDGTNTLKLVPAAAGGYAAWQTANSTLEAANLDHDNDGVSNGVEYFLGGTTNTTGFTSLPTVNTVGGLSVTFTKHATYTGSYTTDFTVETSATLTGAWATEPADPTPGFTVTFPSATEVKYTFPAGTKNFARLKVTGP
jgi:autotransporter-associated beta strand protein